MKDLRADALDEGQYDREAEPKTAGIAAKPTVFSSPECSARESAEYPRLPVVLGK